MNCSGYLQSFSTLRTGKRMYFEHMLLDQASPGALERPSPKDKAARVNRMGGQLTQHGSAKDEKFYA